MIRMVREKAWNVARSSAMGNSAVTNPNNLAKIMRNYTTNKEYITMNEFLNASRNINGLDLKNCVVDELKNLYLHYVANQNKADGINTTTKEGTPPSVLRLESFVHQVVPKGIDSAGKAAITNLFTGDIKTFDHPIHPYVKGKNNPTWMNSPYDTYDKQWTNEAQKNMISNSARTIGADAHRRHKHIIHGRSMKDTGIFFNTGMKK